MIVLSLFVSDALNEMVEACDLQSRVTTMGDQLTPLDASADRPFSPLF